LHPLATIVAADRQCQLADEIGLGGLIARSFDEAEKGSLG
jgi:hypothetical protein